MAATLNLSGGIQQFTWTISGLGNSFNTSYYKQAGIATGYITEGQQNAPGGIVSSISANSYGTSTSCGTTVSYPAGTYTFRGWVQAANGRYYAAGYDSVVVQQNSAPPTPSGGIVNVTLGSGIASIQWACVYANGTRVPSSGYSTATANLSRTEVGHFYVDSVTLQSGYTFPWHASYGGIYTQATTNHKTTGSTNRVETSIYPDTGKTASLSFSATKTNGGRVAVTLGEGIAAVNIAYRDYFGYRYPNSGTTRYTSDQSFAQVEMVWVESVVFSSGYGVPWHASYGGSYSSNTTSDKTSGSTSTVNTSVYPTSGGYATLSLSAAKVPTYNIAFHSNGGSGSMSSLNNCQYGVSYQLPANQFTRSHTVTLVYNYGGKQDTLAGNCPFGGWAYNGQIFSDRAVVSNLATSGTAMLYAQWDNYSVNLPNPTRTGYVFQGWFTSDGTRVYSPATGISNQTLYAHWKENVISPIISNISHTDTTITISLNRNNATTGSWIIEASLSNFGTVVYTTTITSTTQTTITLTGLTPETTYYIRARHVNGGVSASSNVISATTRTSTFQWTSNDSVYVIKSAVFTDAITAAKWNELIRKVNWCRGRKGLSTVFLNSAVQGQPILATNFTAMRNAIADMYTVTPARSAGDEILATYFANSDTSLKSAINAVITTL